MFEDLRSTGARKPAPRAQMAGTRSQQEELRRQYLPATVRLLLVGESPPASGRFFYERNSGLYRAVREAFQLARPDSDEETFLRRFRDAGCYLVDLCDVPVDDLDQESRRAACIQYEASLACKIRELSPRSIVSVVRSIIPNVQAAIQRAHWEGELLDLPYPGRWTQHRKIFIEALAGRINSLE